MAKKAGGTDVDGGNSIAVDNDGNVYTTGGFRGIVDFDPGPGNFNLTSFGTQDIFISKLDASGNLVWARQFGGPGDNYNSGISIAVDGSGNVYTTGIFMATTDFDPGAGTNNLVSAGSWDIFISKLDASGNYVWAKKFGNTSGSDWGYGLVLDGSGNVYMTGSFYGTVDFDPGAATANLTADYIDVFINKLDASGNYIWAKKMGGIFTDEARAITVDALGNVYTTGNFLGTADFDPGPGVFNLNSNITGGADADLFISKLDASGNFVWAKQLSGWYPYSCYGLGIAVDGSGNVFTTGKFSYVVDFDPGAGIINLTANGYFDGFILKLNSSGDFAWVKQVGGCASDDYATGIQVDGAGSVYVSGIFQFVGDFDPGPGVYNLTGNGNTDAYICKLTAAGNFAWAVKLGGTDYDYGFALTLDAMRNVYTTGQFRGNADMDPGSGTFTLSASGASDIFIVKLNQSVWNGSVSNVWSDGSNWNNSLVPELKSDIVIPGGLARYPTVFEASEINSLFLQPGSSLTVSPSVLLKINSQ